VRQFKAGACPGGQDCAAGHIGGARRRYRWRMMLLRALVIWTVQVLLFCIGIGVAGLTAHLTGPLVAATFDIDELIPTALVFFVVAAMLGWIGDRFWPQDWIYNPLL
jgi:hypothetical protein